MEGSGEHAADLEIASIGSLYTGPWHKKYWSSSRGKDRYPYPIGYDAIRKHAGSTYRMEICEGLKGPLFVVTSSDGDSGSGQTPDIAWENLQKKSGPRVKNCHGKRFSSKIDGVELFGLKNPFVQRLLRELVANINGKAEQSLVSPSLSNEALQTGHNKDNQEFQSYPDLVSCLGKKQSTVKRSPKVKYCSESPGMEARSKRICYQDLINDAGCCISDQAGRSCLHAHDKSAMHFQEKESFSSANGSIVASDKAKMFDSVGSKHQSNRKTIQSATSVGKSEANKDPVTSLHPSRPSAIVAGTSFPLQSNNKLLQPEDPDIFIEKHVIFQEQSRLIEFEDSRINSMENKPNQLDRSLVADLERRNASVATKDSEGEITTFLGAAVVPDSLDTQEDNNAGFALEQNKGSLCSMNDQLIAANPLSGKSTSSVLEVIAEGMPNDFISKSQICSSDCIGIIAEEVPYPVRFIPDDGLSKGLVKESLMDVSSSSGSSNASFGKTDLDLAGQELARSMMTFLLPRALPLLKKTYERRMSRNRHQKSKHDPFIGLVGMSSAGQTVQNNHHTDATCEDKLTAGMPVQQQENNTGENKNAPQNLLHNDSMYEMNQVESHVSNGMVSEPCTECRSQKDVKSVIPDSLEDGPCAHDVAKKRSSPCSLHESDIAPLDEVKHVESLEFPGNIGEESANRHFRCDSAMKLDELKEGIECTSLIPSVDPPYVQNDGSLQCEGERLCNTEGTLNFECISGHHPSSNDQAAHLEWHPAVPDNSSMCWRDNDISRDFHSRCPGISCSPVKRNQFSSGHHLVNSVDANLNSGCANLASQILSIHNPQMQIDGKAEVSGTGSSSLIYVQEIVNSTEGRSPDGLKERKLPHPFQSSITNNIPLSESIICRNFNDSNKLATYHASRRICEGCHAGSTCQNTNIRMPVVNLAKVNQQPDISNTPGNPTAEGPFFNSATVISHIEDASKSLSEDIRLSKFGDRSVSYDDVNEFHAPVESHFSTTCFQVRTKDSSDKIRYQVTEVAACPDKNPVVGSTIRANCKNLSCAQISWESPLDDSSNKEAIYNMELKGSMQLAGCYLHPSPVLSINLISNDEYLQICVLCGCLDGNSRNLFIYMVPLHVQRGFSPSFIGYTSLVFPLFKESSHGELLFERSGLQFTPDGQFLVLLRSIKAPHCREQNVNCLCSKCKVDYYEENAINVVRVEFGYVSVITKLATIETITCILVCEQNYLVAAEESGQLHVWAMNLEWSLSLEEFKLPSFDHTSSQIIELKSLPKCNSLVIGHNGWEDFGLWDIIKRVLLTRFSSPGSRVSQMLPVGFFSWQKMCTVVTGSKTEEQINEAIPRDEWLSVAVENPFLLSLPEDISLWLLVSSALDSEVQHECKTKEPKNSLGGCWRLALAARKMIVMGSALDNRTCAIDISADLGIVGTYDGLVYMWEMSSGKKLSNLHSFQGEGVSCIKVDAKSGIIAVATKNGQLMLYVQPPSKF